MTVTNINKQNVWMQKDLRTLHLVAERHQIWKKMFQQ